MEAAGLIRMRVNAPIFWPAPKPADEAPKRIRAERRIADLVPGLLDRDLRRRGFMAGRIVTDWPQIIGQPLDRVTMPLELTFPPGKRAGGTLYVKVAGPFATEIQMLGDLLIERVNAYFGYGAVARLRIRPRHHCQPPKRCG